METLQPYLTYAGIGLGLLLGILAIVWLVATFSFMRRTSGLNGFLVRFFKTLTENKVKTAYGMTTPTFQAETGLKDFRKFVKRNKLTQYQRLSATVPELGENGTFRLTLMIKLSGDRELPMTAIVLKDEQQAWRLEALDV
ncbi:MAG: hypothetical protein F6J87_09565 [Spirulina sp. SIO3F2]|nr:hypothetical protein [Spirulina sp. SIO3F2]